MGSGTDLYEYEDARLRKGEIGLETPKQQPLKSIEKGSRIESRVCHYSVLEKDTGFHHLPKHTNMPEGNGFQSRSIDVRGE